jgi:hypothetical protein
MPDLPTDPQAAYAFAQTIPNYTPSLKTVALFNEYTQTTDPIP